MFPALWLTFLAVICMQENCVLLRCLICLKFLLFYITVFQLVVNYLKLFSNFITVLFGRYKIMLYVYIMNNEQLQQNEYYRTNSYYWQGIIYISLGVNGDKTLCQIKGSKSSPKWIKTSQLSKIYKDFSNL